MKNIILKVLNVILIFALLLLPSCNRSGGEPTSPSEDNEGKVYDPPFHVDIFKWLDDEKFTVDSHPFNGSEQVAPHSFEAVGVGEHTPQRNADAIYNWEQGPEIDPDTMTVDQTEIIPDQMYCYWSKGLTNWASSSGWLVNFDAAYKNGVTHLVYQTMSVTNNGMVTNSKIYYRRWHGNLGDAVDYNYWTPAVEVTAFLDQLDTQRHVNPSVAVNDRGDVLVVWNTHGSVGLTSNLLFPPDHPDSGEAVPGDFTYSVKNDLEREVRIYAAVLERDSIPFLVRSNKHKVLQNSHEFEFPTYLKCAAEPFMESLVKGEIVNPLALEKDLP